MPKKKPYLMNDHMSNPEHVAEKRQDYFALKNAFSRMQWGSAYLPHPCFVEITRIERALVAMEEPMKYWEVEKPRWRLWNGNIVNELPKGKGK